MHPSPAHECQPTIAARSPEVIDMRGRALKKRMEQQSSRQKGGATVAQETMREAPGGNDDPAEGARPGERPLAPATGPAGSDDPVEGPRA
jgi:hypothetical protein